MKESPRRYTNPFLSDEENDKVNFWNSPELLCSVVNDDLSNEQFIKSSAACNVASEFFGKTTGFYPDKNIIQCKLSEFIVCCKESAFNDVKDICVDDGSNSIDKDMIKGNLDAMKHERLRSSSVEDVYMDADFCFGTEDQEVAIKEGGIKEKCATDSSVLNGLKNVSADDSEDDGFSKSASKLNIECNTENHSPDNSMQPEGEKLNSSGNLCDNASTEQLVSDSVQQDWPLASHESVLKPSNDGFNDVDQQPCQSSVVEITKRPLEESEIEDQGRHCQTTHTSNGSTTDGSVDSNTDTKNPAMSGGPCEVERSESVHELSPDTQNVVPDNLTTTHEIQREGESSFSMANPVSGLLTSSGPIPFSGSISLRSDSSTTSTRSFAFPVLQTEWSGSPVRMAKAERKRSRRWRQGLLCCRF